MAEIKTEPKTTTITYRDALHDAILESMEKDERVFVIGEDVGRYGGAFAVTKGLLEKFGSDRIMDVPLSESGFTGVGIGASMGGMRPIVEIMTVNFSLLSFDQIVNNAATLSHMSGGQVNVPVVFRISGGIGRQLAAQHSHSWEPLFAHIPGLKVISIGTHEDARHVLKEALKESDPVIIFEYTAMLNMEGELPEEIEAVNISSAKIRKTGKDITIITYGPGVYKALEASKELSKEGIDAEVLDLRVLRPIDTESIVKTVSKTHRILIVEEAWKSVSISSEVISRIVENAFFELDSPIERLCGIEVPIPYPKHLEDASIPQKEDIVNAVKKMLQHD